MVKHRKAGKGRSPQTVEKTQSGPEKEDKRETRIKTSWFNGT
jgi:hypothetical protein